MFERISGGNVFTGNRVKAVYREVQEDIYKHNPYIEALPPILTKEDIINRLRRRPSFSEAERSRPAEQRLHAVQKIANLVEPMCIHLELENRFSRMIRNGYMARNPITAEWVKQIRTGFPDIVWSTGDNEYIPVIRSTANGFAIIGTSGVGKSTSIESVLSLYPQVIFHTEYNGNSFDRAQLVWLKLDCPFDGSLKGLCLNFFQAIDQILNTQYYRKFGNRKSVDELLPTMANIASLLGLGVIVIDEIQRLSEAKSGGAAKMLNFFVQLTNTIGVPVVLIGTFKALKILTSEFAMARRGAGQGDIIWSNLAMDEEWDYFVEKLWRYQWTKEPVPLGPALSQALYDKSQGIIDIAVKLYMLAQWHVIGEEREFLDPNLIRDVATESLKLAQPILQALKTKDISRLSLISDVYPPIHNLDDYYNRSMRRVITEGTLNTLRNQKQSEKKASEDISQTILFTVAKWLVEAGIEPKLARECAIKAIDRHAGGKELSLAMQEAFFMAKDILGKKVDDNSSKNSVEKKDTSKKSPQTRKQVSLSGDLREIVAKGKKKAIPVYHSLVDAGVIKSVNEFLV